MYTVIRIEQERKRLNLSVAEAASKAGISRSAWYRISNGEREPSIKTLRAMAKAVDLEMKVRLVRDES